MSRSRLSRQHSIHWLSLTYIPRRRRRGFVRRSITARLVVSHEKQKIKKAKTKKKEEEQA